MTAPRGELGASLHARITSLCAQGDEHCEHDRLVEALCSFEAAWDLLPEPRKDWEAATWILTAIGDVEFQRGEFGRARDILQDAMHCPGAIGNPFVHLRLGQALLELSETDRAKDELTRVYMGGGRELFEGSDPKYFEFLSSFLRLS